MTKSKQLLIKIVVLMLLCLVGLLILTETIDPRFVILLWIALPFIIDRLWNKTISLLQPECTDDRRDD